MMASIAVNAAKFSGPPVVSSRDRGSRERGARRPGPTTRCFDEPNSAYSTNAGGAA